MKRLLGLFVVLMLSGCCLEHSGGYYYYEYDQYGHYHYIYRPYHRVFIPVICVRCGHSPCWCHRHYLPPARPLPPPRPLPRPHR